MAVLTTFSYKPRRGRSSECSCCSMKSDGISRNMPHVCVVHKWLICVWIAIVGFLVFGIIASLLIVDTIHQQRSGGATDAAALPEGLPEGRTREPRLKGGDEEVVPGGDIDHEGTTRRGSWRTSSHRGSKATVTTTHAMFIPPNTLPSGITQNPSTSSAEEKEEEIALKELITLILVITCGVGIVGVLTVVMLITIYCPEGKNKYRRITDRNLQRIFTSRQNSDAKIHRIFTLPLRRPKVKFYTVLKQKYKKTGQSDEAYSVLIFSDELRPPSYEEAVKCQDQYDYCSHNCTELESHHIRY